MTRPRTPWSQPGWLAEMTAWIDAALATVGRRRRGPVREVRMWQRSAVVTFATDRGRMWAKAVPEVFAHEVAITSLLADIDPGVVPPLVAADRALGRFITVHVEGPALAAVDGGPAAWQATMARLAELQRVLAAEPGELATAGVSAAPLAGLADAIPRLLADETLLMAGRPGGLSVAEAAALRNGVPAYVAACDELASSGVPDSLEHGDLSADEVIIGEMGPVFLDWSDGSITHPFLSAAAFLGHASTAPAGSTGTSWPPTSALAGSGVRVDRSGRAPRHGCRSHRPATAPGRPVRRSDPARPRRLIRERSRRARRSPIDPVPMSRRRIPDEVLSAAHARAEARSRARLGRGRPSPRGDRGSRLEDRRSRDGFRADPRRAGRPAGGRPDPLRLEHRRAVAVRRADDRAGDDRAHRHGLAGRSGPGAGGPPRRCA